MRAWCCVVLQVNLEHYPEWEAQREAWKEKGVRVLTYINPYVVDVEGKFPHRRNLFKEAVQGGYLVKNSSGESPVREGWDHHESPVREGWDHHERGISSRTTVKY